MLLLEGITSFFLDGYAEDFVTGGEVTSGGWIARSEAGCHIHTLDHPPENGIAAIQSRLGCIGDEELASI